MSMQFKQSKYEDILIAMEHIRGESSSMQLYPEYATMLAKADRSAAAAEAIRKYLAFNRESKTPISTIDKMRLDLALDGLVTWSDEYPDLYGQLKAYRETGNVAGDASDDETDSELTKDLQTLQGIWETKQTGDVPNSVMLRQEIDGNNTTVKWYDADGKVVYGRDGKIELGRSGGCKVFTFYFAGDDYAESAFIYIIEDDKLTLVSGMLANRQSQPQTALRTLTRVVANEE